MKTLANILFLFCCMASCLGQGRQDDYYYEIPENPESYTPGSVAARVVDGLGFRYYWGTEGLRKEDLSFRPGEEARSTEETIDHILILSQILVDAVNEKPFNGIEISDMTFEDKRTLTLKNIQIASRQLKKSTAEDLERYDMIFSSGNEFPFWNLLNGPIADAINHVGQIISFRRTSGNPFNQDVSVLQGKIRR